MEPTQLDFYAPYQMPDGTWIFGAAAMNRRVADADGQNMLAFSLVNMGMKLGFEAAVNAAKKPRSR